MITTAFSFDARAQASCLSSDYFCSHCVNAVVAVAYSIIFLDRSTSSRLYSTNLVELFSTADKEMVERIN